MLSGKVPFPGRTEPEIIYNVIKGEFHFDYQAFQTVSDECKNFIKKCLIREYEQRYSATEGASREAFPKPLVDETINKHVFSSFFSFLEAITFLGAHSFRNAFTFDIFLFVSACDVCKRFFFTMLFFMFYFSLYWMRDEREQSSGKHTCTS